MFWPQINHRVYFFFLRSPARAAGPIFTNMFSTKKKEDMPISVCRLRFKWNAHRRSGASIESIMLLTISHYDIYWFFLKLANRPLPMPMPFHSTVCSEPFCISNNHRTHQMMPKWCYAPPIADVSYTISWPFCTLPGAIAGTHRKTDIKLWISYSLFYFFHLIDKFINL